MASEEPNNQQKVSESQAEESKDYEQYSAKRIPWKVVKKAKRIVIKIGTRALIKKDRTFDDQFFSGIAEDIGRMQNEGKEIILVSSGAVNAGVNALGLQERPKELVEQQVMAAIGNPLLMTQYQKFFTFCKIGQVLVTQEDFSNRISYNNLRNTMEEMIKRRIIPIFNENDVVSVNELQEDNTEFNFTDNDILAGLVAASCEADLLVIFSDVEGLYTKHPNSPRAVFLAYIPEITKEVMAMGQKGSKFGRGGMISKLIAADMVTKAGGSVIIADAKKSRLKEIFQGNTKLSFFSASSENLKNKQIWMIFGANVKGKIQIDDGAKKAIESGASLLFQGIQEFSGNFNKGDVVGIITTIIDPETKEREEFVIARAKINYSLDELQHIHNIPHDKRKDYFKLNNIREIISHENMVFVSW